MAALGLARKNGAGVHLPRLAGSSPRPQMEAQQHDQPRFLGAYRRHSGGCGGIGEAVRLRLASTGSTVIVWDIAVGADERIDLTGENAVK